MFKCFRQTKKKVQTPKAKIEISHPQADVLPEVLQEIEKAEVKLENDPQPAQGHISLHETPPKEQKSVRKASRFPAKLSYAKSDFSRVKGRKLNAFILTDDRIKSWEKGKTIAEAFTQLAKMNIFMEETERLSINLKRYKEGINQNLKFISQFIKKMRSLKSLRLDFGGCFRLKEAGLKHLAEALRNIKHLQEITLDFNHCSHIGDQEMMEIAKMLKTLRSLKKVNLNFRRCLEVNDVGVIGLSRALRPLMSLQDLRLNFNECRKVSNIGIRYLAENIKKLALIKSINLGFVWWTIDGRGMNCLSQALENFKFLTALTLNFESCHSLSEESLQNLVQCFGKLTLLEDLSLNVARCNGVTFEVLESLNAVLKRLACLQNLELNFQRCNNLAGERLKNFCRGIIELSLLQRLEVIFSDCICLAGMNDLLELIKKRKTLEKISINSREGEHISSQKLVELEKAIEFRSVSYQLGYDLPKEKAIEHVQGGECPLMRIEINIAQQTPILYVFLRDP